jgi:hypothetical protein
VFALILHTAAANDAANTNGCEPYNTRAKTLT